MPLRLLALLVTAYSLGWPQVPKHENSAGSDKAATAHGYSGPVNPIHVIVDSPITTTVNSQAQSEGSKSKTEEKPLPWLIQAFTKPEWLTVIVTAVYTLVALLQWLAIRRQASLMEKQITQAKLSSVTSTTTASDTLAAIQRQADLMQEQTGLMDSHSKAVQASAEAAAVSAQAAKSSADSLLVAERAWLLMHVEGKAGSELVAQFWFKNYGRTPAWITTITADYRKVRGDLPLNYADISSAGLSNENGWIVPSNEVSKVHIRKIAPNGLLDTRELEMTQRGELRLVFIGCVKYRDVFEVERETRFCQNFIPGRGWSLCGARDCNKRT